MDYALIAGATVVQNLQRSGSPYTLPLTSIVQGEGISLPGANAFQVESVGAYLANLIVSPKAVTGRTGVIFQIWNVTLGTVIGQINLNANTEAVGGVITQNVVIPFNVVNAAHTFTLRAVVSANLPQTVSLPLIGNFQAYQLIIRSVAGSAVSNGGYGDGSGGNVIVAAPAALVEDMYYDNLTVNAGIALNAAGFRIFVRNTLTMAAGSLITNNGGAGAAADAGGAAGVAAPAGTVGGGFIGAAGAPGFGAGVAGTAATTSAGGTGGASGAGAGGAGAAGGAAAAPTAAQGGGAADRLKVVRAAPFAGSANLAGIGVAGAQTRVAAGAGGASGGGNGVAVTGAGGGGGGGVVFVAARIFAGTGTLQAIGGAGGAGSAAVNAGGGGGGGGGVVITVSDAPARPATILTAVTGGAGGVGGAGGGGAGAAGVVGNAIHVQNGG